MHRASHRGVPLSSVLRFLFVLALAGGAVAVVSMLTVQQREELVALHAESFALDGRVRFESSTVGNAGTSQSAVGTDADPVEIAPGNPAARTALTAGHWTYTVVVSENSSAAIGSGTFKVELTMSGDPKGYVVLRQQTAEAASREGATVTFDLGAALPAAPLFFVKVSAYAPSVSYHDLGLNTIKDGATYRFQTAGGSTVNPAITFPLSSILRLQLTRADDSIHNFAIYAGDVVTGTKVAASQDVKASSPATTFQWPPSSAGTWNYYCEYHPATMTGTLTVTS